MQDIIQREVIIKASKERVYAAITDPAQLTKWFPDSIEGAVEVGQEPYFVFNGHGKSQIHIVEARPHDYFAYRWVPGGNQPEGALMQSSTTLVEFRITDHEDAVKVTLTESGFNSLPSAIAEAAFKDNDGGWNFMMGRLGELFGDTK